MEESASFSGTEIEDISMNFSELRKKGLEYIQRLSGAVWTDYNSHDPGVTILEQLCYALTDISFRSSLPISDLLATEKDILCVLRGNAFIPPASILSSHPVTIDDTRKMIIDQFDEIQNVWITINENIGYEEQIRGINQIEILPKIHFLKAMVINPGIKSEFLIKVDNFLNENRNIGESYKKIRLLKPQDISISFKVYVHTEADVESIIAQLFMQLLEYVYTPVQFSSFNEMQQAGYSMEETFSGPKLTRGFFQDNQYRNRLKSFQGQGQKQKKDDIHKNRLKTIHIDELQKIFTKVDGIDRCEVKPFAISNSGERQLEKNANNGQFFHILKIDKTTDFTDNRFDRIYENMTVLVNNKELPVLDKQKINHLFSELWSKKHRAYPIESTLNEQLTSKLVHKDRKLEEYYSLQRQFPLIYGIGAEGISKNEPETRHVQAKQLKAYLMLFEQHLANHLAQLANLNEYFNIDFDHGKEKTYFAQKMNSIPHIDELLTGDFSKIESDLEPESVFYTRKNKIYNHLLARFGEEISDIPWKVALQLNIISNEVDFNRIVLHYKSNFLLQLEHLSYFRTRGESFHSIDEDPENPKFEWVPSGLEDIIRAKTGIPVQGENILVPDFINTEEPKTPIDESESMVGLAASQLGNNFRSLLPREMEKSYPKANTPIINNTMFGAIELKALYKQTLNLKNFKISENQLLNNEVQVVFQKEKDCWINLYSCDTEEQAIQKIHEIRSFFIDQNTLSERLYLVDHILLRDILKGSKYGFKFIDYDEYEDEKTESLNGNDHDEEYSVLFQTIENESWSGSKKERNSAVNKFYNFGLTEDSYRLVTENWVMKDAGGKIIVSCKPGRHNRQTNKNVLITPFQRTRNIIQLFNSPESENGRLRFKEVEKIRAKRSKYQSVNYGQNRLVFQRKLANNLVVDEDFFNLMVTIILPDWPARFQSERFRDYISELVRERLPSHISCDILWVDDVQFNRFEKKYHAWQKLRLDSKNTGIVEDKISAAALDVYGAIMDLKNK
jgi:hypothetical protein